MPVDQPHDKEMRLQQFAMRLSLGVGFVMFGGKFLAYWITGSAAILSDAAESVVHVVAVSFATYSLWLSQQPPDPTHHYGHEKISFFSAGFEGAMIVIAALYIIYVSIQKWIAGLVLEHLGTGTLLVAGAAVINGGLGTYLVWVGKKQHSLILEANGRHVLTDCYTSAGVIVGLLLTLRTGWLHFDPILAILVALNILWSGAKLMRQSIGGLMDEVDPEIQSRVRRILDEKTTTLGIQYHGLRHRNAGNTIWIEFHLLFHEGISLQAAHRTATEIEETIRSNLPFKAEVLSHLETIEDHQRVHTRQHFEDFSD
ncbi:MAG: cation diffusion facilitator family transporter [Acidobacteriota bacterium]